MATSTGRTGIVDGGRQIKNSISTPDGNISSAPAIYQKLIPNAVDPEQNSLISKIYICSRTENRQEDSVGVINNFRTGLIIKPPRGYHFIVIPRPNLNLGYFVVGNQLIQYDNNEELIIPMMKFSDTADIDVPYYVADLLLQENKMYNFSCNELQPSYPNQPLATQLSYTPAPQLTYITPQMMQQQLRSQSQQTQQFRPIQPPTRMGNRPTFM